MLLRIVLALGLIALIPPGVKATCNGSMDFPYGQSVVAVNTTDGPRYFILYVPSGYSAQRPAPVLVLMHGLNRICESFIDKAGFKPFADRDGFLIAAPCASVGLLGIGWNAGTCCGYLNETTPNDVEFVAAVVRTVSAGMCVDPAKTYLAGDSNGAMMCEALVCQEPDLWSAVASNSGITALRPGNAAAVARCTRSIAAKSEKRPRILMIHGDADPLVPWGGDALLGFPPVPLNVQGWVDRNQCTGSPRVTLNVTNFTNQVWEDCAGWGGRQSGGVEIVRHIGGGHEWPFTDDFNTTLYIYRFLFGPLGR